MKLHNPNDPMSECTCNRNMKTNSIHATNVIEFSWRNGHYRVSHCKMSFLNPIKGHLWQIVMKKTHIWISLSNLKTDYCFQNVSKVITFDLNTLVFGHTICHGLIFWAMMIRCCWKSTFRNEIPCKRSCASTSWKAFRFQLWSLWKRFSFVNGSQ